jgi:hypothetical protein
MKKSKEQKQAEKLAKLLGLEAPTAVTKQAGVAKSMEVEAALEYYDNPRTFKHKECKQCGREFATRGAPVAYCTDDCRARAYEERMGVKWQPLRTPEERWGSSGEPLVVPPEALEVVDHALSEQAHREVEKLDEVVVEDDPELLDILAEYGL